MPGLLIAVAIGSVPGMVLASTPPPHLPFQDVHWAASMKSPPTRGIALGKLYVEFEKTTLADVRHAASIGTIDHQGDASESIYWLCYSHTAADVGYRIWIASNGEMGGADRAVTLIAVERMTNAKPTEDCPSLPAKLQPISLNAPIWIGTTDRDVERALGAPSHRQGKWRQFDYRGTVPGQCQGGYDMNNWLQTKSEHGRISTIFAGQVTSC